MRGYCTVVAFGCAMFTLSFGFALALSRPEPEDTARAGMMILAYGLAGIGFGLLALNKKGEQ